MSDNYDSDSYIPESDNCEMVEREILILDDDGYVEVDSSDIEGPTTDWIYKCIRRFVHDRLQTVKCIHHVTLDRAARIEREVLKQEKRNG